MHCVFCDLSDWNVARQTVQKLGPIDLLVNNAGVGSLQNFLDITEEEFDK